jgi:ankyrin repeat protein
MNIQDQLSEAIDNEKLELVEELLKKGADANKLNKLNETPLMVAAECDSTEIIQLLLAYGAKINKQGHEANTPLHCAVNLSIDGTIQSGGAPGDEPTDIIIFLLENGADLHAKNNSGKTPIDWAHDFKSEKIVKLLKKYDL